MYYVYIYVYTQSYQKGSRHWTFDAVHLRVVYSKVDFPDYSGPSMSSIVCVSMPLECPWVLVLAFQPPGYTGILIWWWEIFLQSHSSFQRSLVVGWFRFFIWKAFALWPNRTKAHLILLHRGVNLALVHDYCKIKVSAPAVEIAPTCTYVFMLECCTIPLYTQYCTIVFCAVNDILYKSSGFFDKVSNTIEFERGYQCLASQKHKLDSLTDHEITASLTVRDFQVQAFVFKKPGQFTNCEDILSLFFLLSSLSLSSLSLSLSLSLPPSLSLPLPLSLSLSPSPSLPPLPRLFPLVWSITLMVLYQLMWFHFYAVRKCLADSGNGSKIVPIAVGAALVVLVIIVFIAFVISKLVNKRKTSSYEALN